MSEPPPIYRILGLAGHIDHGKTSLVRRLTGVDTDRLPEEKKRGITIDLGFANLDLPGVRLGVVDVPGHERFVHNMVAGATGIDLALLVVAADDSVMPQTREHLAILHLLGVSAGLTAITKSDLVDGETLDFVREELRETLAGTFLAEAPIVPISNATGAGIEELREQLERMAKAHRRPERRRIFRLPIDRVFAVEGHGTVVTGTVLGGEAAVGDALVLAPEQKPVRVRRLQSHNVDQVSVFGGQRAAVNLVGVKADETHRGDELTVPGYLEPSRRMLVSVTLLENVRPLKDRQLLRVHLAARETTVRLLLKGGVVDPGETRFAELRSREPLLAEYGQRFILRELSPVATLGGGRVLDPFIPTGRRIRDPAETARKLAEADPLERLAGFLEERDVDELTPAMLACRLGIDPPERESLLARLLAEKRLIRLSQGLLVHRRRRDSLGEQIVARCRRELVRRQPNRTLERATLALVCRRLAGAAMLDAMFDELVQREKLVKAGDRLGPPGQQALLTRNQQKTLTQMVDVCRQAGLSPPMLSELSKNLQQSVKELEVLAKVAVEDGLLVRAADGLYFDPQILSAAARLTADRLRLGGPAAVAQLKDVWGVSRKYAVPLCEYFDAVGVTVRAGDLRTIGPQAPAG